MGWNRTDLFVLVAGLGLGQAASVLALMRAAAGVPAAVPSCLPGKSSAEAQHTHSTRNTRHSTRDEMHSTCNDNDSARCITFSAFSSSAFFGLFSSSSFSFFFLLSSSSFSFFFLFCSSSFSFFFLFCSSSFFFFFASSSFFFAYSA